MRLISFPSTIACSMSLGRPGYEANLFPFHYSLQYEPGEAWV